MSGPSRFVRFFDEIGISDVGLVGGKNASLGEMHRHLRQAGIKIPDGFAITADAYRETLDAAQAWKPLAEALDGLNADDMEGLARGGRRAREIIQGAAFPSALTQEILAAYAILGSRHDGDLTLAVRSSATAEDLPSASFAGQQETFLNVRGADQLLDACHRCFASLFTDRAIHYRLDQGFDHSKVALSIGVMKMVRSDLGSSGVIFTLDTESGFRDVVLITAAYGLGENVVQGAVEPDEFLVFKPTFLQGHRQVLRRALGSKKIKMIYSGAEAGAATRNVPVPPEDRERFCLSDAEVLQLADYALTIERHYGEEAGHPVPMDIEWAKDGLDRELYIVQARPETVASRKREAILEEYAIRGGGKVLITGHAVGERVGEGMVRILSGPAQLGEFKRGDVLVADITTPDWEPVMKQAAAIVTNRGGRACHAAIVAREFGIPAVVGTEQATTVLRTGQTVTVSCAEGEIGQVYEGAVPFEVRRTDVGRLPRPRTEIMLIIGNPDLAFQSSFLPNDGVGLARMEFIITEHIRAHPLALLHPERIEDEKERAAILQLMRGHTRPADYFVQRLAEGVAVIAAAFYPKPVIVRMSDFKTNEYANLLGGRCFEPKEENPMLGFRGASRYAHPAYTEGFALECAAIRYVRERLGLVNVKVMIPFCRRLEEAERVVGLMKSLGLERGKGGLEIYVMCEIPNNVMLIDEFSRIFDGFSIGSNDLAQLTLGVDRDSAIVAFDFDERDPGVKKMLQLAIEGARRNGRHCGICGQAPSDYPEFAEYLIRLGIDSISLNPDSVLKTTQRVLEVESRLKPPQRLAS
jgi:pyruvate, water dikinase